MSGFDDIKAILKSPLTLAVQSAMEYMEGHDLWTPEEVVLWMAYRGHSVEVINTTVGDIAADPFYIQRLKGWSDGKMTLRKSLKRT